MTISKRNTMEQACPGKYALAGWLVGLVAIFTFPIGGFAAEADFRSLDAQVEESLNEVLDLGAEMAVLEESRELSPNNQLLVLVSVDESQFFRLDAIQLNIDNRTVSFHQYEDEELVALMNGGSQRLFWEDIPSGNHDITVSLFGRTPNDPDFSRVATHKIFIGAKRSVVELRVATGRNQVFPNLTITEWK